jgi:ABC-type branched-subunit amino acid transport system substrate-binding protein
LKLFIKCLILINILNLAAWAQNDDYLLSPEVGLESASKSYRNGRYTEAYNKFTSLAEHFPESGFVSAFRFMAAKSCYKSGDYNNAIKLWNDFINDFQGSSLRSDAGLYLGHSLFQAGRRYEAASEYMAAIEANPKSEAARSASENLMPLARRGLTIVELRRLIRETPGSSVAEPIEYTLAKREIDAGHYRQGINALRSFMNRYPGSRDFKQAKVLLEQASGISEGELGIGLLVPASGNYQEYGRAMIEGARLAIKDNSKNLVKIELSIKDTEGSAIIAANVAEQLSAEEPVAVVGPLRSESAISAAIVLNEHGIPMITPTASESGIARIGPNVFQISSPTDEIGRSMAEYAFREQGIRDFAIIAPDDPDGTKIANAFARAVYELGGDIVLTTFYTPGTTDFKGQIIPLRDILLVKTENQLASGKLDTSDFWDSKKDTLLLKEDWPVKLGGLFLPGDPDDLKLLIPQVKYHVIRTQLLGNNGWDSEGLMREVGAYVAGAVFATDFHVRSDDPDRMQFNNSFSAAYGHAPDRVAALTYDAVGMIILGILDGNRNPDDIRLYLSHIEAYDGVSGPITFKGVGRANNGVAIYSVDGRKLAEAK